VESESVHTCVICGEERLGHERWFLIAANRWQDKLRILHWNDLIASQAGVRSACCASHVQELVVHWMTTGSVDHPFARVQLKARKHGLRQVFPFSAGDEAEGCEVDTSGTKAIGELSVHRESMQRILRESPHSLTSILDALLSALQREQAKPEKRLEAKEEEELCEVGQQV
jgi:hypothetical protein